MNLTTRPRCDTWITWDLTTRTIIAVSAQALDALVKRRDESQIILIVKAFKGNKFNRLAIDFDGVIMRPTRKRFNPAICPGDIVPGAAEAIEHLASRYMLTVFSARANSEEGAAAIAEWLSGHGLLQFF